MTSQSDPPRAKATESRALVFDPPSNVRLTPNGETLCSIRARQSINVYSRDGEWYKTDYCGGSGYIHQSQLRVEPVKAFVEYQHYPGSAPAPGAVDRAVRLINELYAALSMKQYAKALSSIDPSIQWQYKSDFFNQFDRVTLQNFRVTSQVGSTVNLEGVVNFVWPDGSVQRETRSFSVDTSRQPPVLTASEFGAVVKSR